MRPQQQNLAILLALGWKYTTLGWREPNGLRCEEPPDYLNDLNAMHEAEGFLCGEDWARYFDSIRICGAACGVRATAAQRAEVFLRTLNLWKP